MMTKFQKCEHIMLSISILFWGAVLIYFYLHPELSAYINQKFHLYVLIGGLAALVMGVFNILTMNTAADCGHDHSHDDGEDCEHNHSNDLNPFIALVFIATPLLFSIVKTTHRISIEHASALSAGDMDPSLFNFIDIPPFTLETLEQRCSKAEDGSFQLSLLEIFYSAGDSEQEKVMSGLAVETEGRLRDEPHRNSDSNRMRLYRLFMTCCAADAKAVPVSIEFNGELPDYEHHSWVKLAGELTYETHNNVSYPVIKVKRITPSPEPAEEWSRPSKR